MELPHSTNFKMQSFSLVWRRVKLRLSVQQDWTRRYDVHILSVHRTQRRFPLSEKHLVHIEQIALDSSTRLLSPTSCDLRRLRFKLQCGDTRHSFQAPHAVAYEKWRVFIAAAIGHAEEMEQTMQMSKLYSMDAVWTDKMQYASVYTRDALNYKLIRLQRPTTFKDVKIMPTLRSTSTLHSQRL